MACVASRIARHRMHSLALAGIAAAFGMLSLSTGTKASIGPLSPIADAPATHNFAGRFYLAWYKLDFAVCDG